MQLSISRKWHENKLKVPQNCTHVQYLSKYTQLHCIILTIESRIDTRRLQTAPFVHAAYSDLLIKHFFLGPY